MPRRETEIIALPAGPAGGKPARDARIDAFRGLALAMILIDHMPRNPYEHITMRNFGFSDAAEAFFLMSGIAAGIAYSPKIRQWIAGERPTLSATSPFWKRAWTLYRVHILLTVWAIAMYAVASDLFFRAEFREMHNLALIYSDPSAALWGIATLQHQIGYVNILPAYIVLMLVFTCTKGTPGPNRYG